VSRGHLRERCDEGRRPPIPLRAPSLPRSTGRSAQHIKIQIPAHLNSDRRAPSCNIITITTRAPFPRKPLCVSSMLLFHFTNRNRAALAQRRAATEPHQMDPPSSTRHCSAFQPRAEFFQKYFPSTAHPARQASSYGNRCSNRCCRRRKFEVSRRNDFCAKTKYWSFCLRHNVYDITLRYLQIGRCALASQVFKVPEVIVAKYMLPNKHCCSHLIITLQQAILFERAQRSARADDKQNHKATRNTNCARVTT